MVSGKRCYKQIHVFHSEHCRIGVQVSSVLRDSGTQSPRRLCIALGGRLLCDQASLHRLAILECCIGRPLYYWKECCDFHARARILGNAVINRFTLSIRSIAELAFKYQASCVILAHNHPGGSASPSEEDCYVTKQVYTGLQYLNVALEDHYIIGKNAVISMREHGFWETLL